VAVIDDERLTGVEREIATRQLGERRTLVRYGQDTGKIGT
jgi:hypothetical protein